MKALLVWEMGQDLGHVSILATVARVLIDLDYEVVCVLKETSHVASTFGDLPITYLPFPPTDRVRRSSSPTISMADILSRRGFDDPSRLSKQIEKWQAVYDAVQPDLVVFDFAPMALLAARNRDFKKAVIGTGWGTLAPGYSVLPLNLWADIDPELIRSSEKTLVDSINHVCRAMSCAEVNYVSDLYESDLTLIVNFPDLDIYGPQRNNAIYLGPIEENRAGPVNDNWLEKGSNVFAYLKSGHSITTRTLNVLKRLNVNSIVYIPSLSDDSANAMRRDGFKVSTTPVNLRSLLPKVDAVICHAGLGTLGRSIMAGTPALALPLQLEQANTAELYTRSGAGLHAGPSASEEELEKKLSALLQNEVYMDCTHALRKSLNHPVSAKTRIRNEFASMFSYQ
ncbi:glycosyltransferase [Saccharospirillum salsuginis]|uniref:UDP:flavonoid glycosyltransferase YjiC, YdhE family n=1 Tax=Saccharospirillum salsuginis TaxID=418750 RepID=A0A918KTG9_9GAMM|nr:glycosyltransferase [Saccharospirillum salsuginis]GGX73702.1 hypothetical protein GCM10007392_46480 [Saccharospirillum salsuginis]